MAKIDDLLQRRAKQIVLAVVARLAHGSSLTANLAVKGIMSPASRKSQNARNPTSTPGFLAKSITCSGQITTINQSLPNSSRATQYEQMFSELALQSGHTRFPLSKRGKPALESLY